MSRALDGEDEDDVILQECLSKSVLIIWCGGPDTFLLRNFYVSDVAALHDEVAGR